MARPTKYAPSFCYVCGAVQGTPQARDAHMLADHPGVTTKWRGRDIYVLDAAGAESKPSKAQLQTWRRAAIASGPPLPFHPKAGPAKRSFGSIAGGAGAPARPQSDPPAVDDDPAPLPRPTIIQPTIRLSDGAKAEQTRDTVREALTEKTLAEIIRELSVALSDADGAGPAGHLNMIQAAQIAHLLYDSTVDLIVDRFRGNVTRFKLSAAILLIVVAKGRIHVQAIAGRVRDRRLGISSAPSADEQEIDGNPGDDWQAAQLDEEVAAPVDPIAELARRQRDWGNRSEGVAS